MQFHLLTYSGLPLPRLVAYTATATEGGTDKPIMSILPALGVSLSVVLMVPVNNSPTTSTGSSAGCVVGWEFIPRRKEAAHKIPKFEQKTKIKQLKNSSSEIPYQLAAVTRMAQLR
jgi:hypothetical protein